MFLFSCSAFKRACVQRCIVLTEFCTGKWDGIWLHWQWLFLHGIAMKIQRNSVGVTNIFQWQSLITPIRNFDYTENATSIRNLPLVNSMFLSLFFPSIFFLKLMQWFAHIWISLFKTIYVHGKLFIVFDKIKSVRTCLVDMIVGLKICSINGCDLYCFNCSLHNQNSKMIDLFRFESKSVVFSLCACVCAHINNSAR